MRAYGAEHLVPGDGILINDPYLGGVHLNDITLITPVFFRGELVGYVANIAHHVDVGGSAPGSIGVSNEIYQEGMVIPPVRFVKEGEIDRDLFAMIRANFRGTKEISGDFRAQTAANRLGVQRLEALLEPYGTAEFTRYLDELLHYTERRTATAFAQFPDGTFSAESYMDGDGMATNQSTWSRPCILRRGASASISPSATCNAPRRPTPLWRRPIQVWCMS
jgi:N-methylhydantoinase B